MPRKPVDESVKLSELRNIGPTCEADLNAVGVFNLGQLKEPGAEAAFLKLLEGRRQRGCSVKCCNAAYLYALYGAIHGIDWRDLPERNKSSKN